MVTLDPSRLLVGGLGAVFFLIGAVLLRNAASAVRRSRRLSAAGDGTVSGVDPGDVAAVRGTVEPVRNRSVRTYLSEGPAVARRTAIVRNPDGSDPDITHEDYDAVPFDVVDETGRVRVLPPDGRAAWVNPSLFRDAVDPPGRPASESVGPDADASAAVTTYLADQGLSESALDPGLVATERTYRVREWTLDPGEEVFVLGDAVLEEGRVAVSGRETPDGFVLSADGTDIDWMRDEFRLAALLYFTFGAIAAFGGALTLTLAGLAGGL